MSTTTETGFPTTGFPTSGFPTSDAFATATQATAQLREFGERVTENGRALGRLAVDNYENAIAGLIDAEHKAAEATDVEFVKAALGAHATLIQRVNDAYLTIVRATLA